MRRNRAKKPRMMAILFRDKKLKTRDMPRGSGLADPSRRPGSSVMFVRLFGSKQYCWKHCAQNEDRSRREFILYRARSMATHCMHLPKFGSGELVLGMKPPMAFAWTWSRNNSVYSVI
jgi:hypothetical protein